jgi:predicted NACHT family NTPase
LVSGDGNSIDQSRTDNRTVNIYYGLPPDQPAPNRSDRNEKTLINAVWTEVDDRLRQSLHNAILIRLDMAEQRSQVSRPWDSELRTADQNAKPLPPDTLIAEVFDRRDVGGKLLVLGNPGAGKTTTMLDLAAALVQPIFQPAASMASSATSLACTA